jgi:putative thioredoxin
MAESRYITEVRGDNFASQVLENSKRVPVMVDFWAAWCAPCQMLMPILAKLAEEYQGKFLLAKVNTDEQSSLARQYGIRSLPTVILFKDGKPVDQFLGAQPESAIRKVLDRHILRESDRLCADAQAAYERGQISRALASLRKAAEMDPDNAEVQIDLASILLEEGDHAQAESILNALPREVRDEPRVNGLRGLLDFARIAAEAPDAAVLEAEISTSPANSEARLQLAARRVLSGEFEGALDQLLEVLRTDPAARDRARGYMVSIFNLLGGKGDVVSRYRTAMFNALH